ncbi:death-inducer obliterator 1-like [Colius striatus]|uniref:death-inducer obliterator 1-like n=1 Tax=Colius striatus TaxID=57412 RepID=UPI002B1DED86|nr:death-inducer obliterator 1-like [Colius striatus]
MPTLTRHMMLMQHFLPKDILIMGMESGSSSPEMKKKAVKRGHVAAEQQEPPQPGQSPNGDTAPHNLDSPHQTHLFAPYGSMCTDVISTPGDDRPCKKMEMTAPVQKAESESKAEVQPRFQSPAASPTAEPEVHGSPNIPVAESFSPQDSDTSGSDSSLSAVWRGLFKLRSVATYLSKAYPVSGCFDNLSEELPETLRVGGTIPPKAVWDYIADLRTAPHQST